MTCTGRFEPFFLVFYLSSIFLNRINSDFYDKWDGLVNERDRHTRKQWRSCCASAIIPAGRIHRFPKEYWEDLMKGMYSRLNRMGFAAHIHTLTFSVSNTSSHETNR